MPSAPVPPQEVRLARLAGDLDADGHVNIETTVTTETDTSLVWHPDGAGGGEWGPDASGGGGSALEVKDEGVSLDTAVTSIDVTGAGATATHVSHAVTINVPGPGTSGYKFFGPLMVNNPNIVTTDGLPVYLPLVDVDGVPIFIEYTAP